MSFLLEIIRLGLNNLRLHMLRSVLTSLGIILGVGAVIIMVSIGEGSKQAALREIEALGATCVTRQRDGKTFLTDNGNEILDCTFAEGIEDPAFLDGVLSGIAGVVENGLFVDLAHVLVIADEDGNVEIREKD